MSWLRHQVVNNALTSRGQQLEDIPDSHNVNKRWNRLKGEQSDSNDGSYSLAHVTAAELVSSAFRVFTFRQTLRSGAFGSVDSIQRSLLAQEAQERLRRVAAARKARPLRFGNAEVLTNLDSQRQVTVSHATNMRNELWRTGGAGSASDESDRAMLKKQIAKQAESRPPIVAVQIHDKQVPGVERGRALMTAEHGALCKQQSSNSTEGRRTPNAMTQAAVSKPMTPGLRPLGVRPLGRKSKATWATANAAARFHRGRRRSTPRHPLADAPSVAFGSRTRREAKASQQSQGSSSSSSRHSSGMDSEVRAQVQHQ